MTTNYVKYFLATSLKFKLQVYSKIIDSFFTGINMSLYHSSIKNITSKKILNQLLLLHILTEQKPKKLLEA